MFFISLSIKVFSICGLLSCWIQAGWRMIMGYR
jgi:hypothetical protein